MFSSERNWIRRVGSAAMVPGVVGLVACGGNGSGPLETVEARWSIAPQWEAAPAAVAPALSGGGGRLDVYVDSSAPMAGFLAADNAEFGTAFESVLRGAAAQLLRIDGSASSPVAFFGVAENLEKVAAHKVLEKRFYGGGQSRLDKALIEIERTLASGEAEAALVLTDLIVTGEVIGAQGAARHLRDFMRSPAVLSGSLHLGLLGVKDSYRGVRTAGCAAPAGRGCRFSEQRKKWLPLEENAVAPFYVLVFARGREPVERVLTGFAEELEELEVETVTEVLSAASQAEPPAPTGCSIETEGGAGRRQYALFSDREGLFRCARSEKLKLTCQLPPAPRLAAGERKKDEDWLFYSLGEESLELELECEDIRDKDFSIDLEFAAESSRKAAETWAQWSSTSDDRPEDAGRTLRLKEFLEKVRLVPDSYRVVVKLLPKGSAG